MTYTEEPLAAVVVSTHNRPLRLRWLLNALGEQTEDRFETVVAHDSPEPETETLLREHPLHGLRHLTFAPGSVLPAAKRDAAWRAASAPVILFTDDDCRPRKDWVERALAAAAANPGAILQGSTVPDPDEMAVLLGAPWAHTMAVTPPSVWAQTCNIAYPRAVLEAIDGFDPLLAMGEDTDLALRAQATGAALVPVPDLLVHHGVEAAWLPRYLRSLRRWQDMPEVVRRHPRLRRHAFAGVFWKREHAAFAAALLGALARRRRPMHAFALALPWLALSLRHRGYDPRGLARSVSELPGRAAIDATEIALLARGSVRHRTVLL